MIRLFIHSTALKVNDVFLKLIQRKSQVCHLTMSFLINYCPALKIHQSVSLMSQSKNMTLSWDNWSVFTWIHSIRIMEWKLLIGIQTEQSFFPSMTNFQDRLGVTEFWFGKLNWRTSWLFIQTLRTIDIWEKQRYCLLNGLKILYALVLKIQSLWSFQSMKTIFIK